MYVYMYVGMYECTYAGLFRRCLRRVSARTPDILRFSMVLLNTSEQMPG